MNQLPCVKQHVRSMHYSVYPVVYQALLLQNSRAHPTEHDEGVSRWCTTHGQYVSTPTTQVQIRQWEHWEAKPGNSPLKSGRTRI